ncbi:MAG: nuclear transport factor 2 family protein [Fimbriimonadales bacterium]
MKTVRMLIAAVAACLATGSLAQAENPQLRKEIEAVYAKWDALVAKGDLKGLIAMLDPSFVSTDTQGKVTNYEETKKFMASIFKTTKDARMKSTVNHIQAQSHEVVAWMTMKVSFKMKKGDKWVPTTFTGRFAETLKRIDGRWKFVASQEFPPE